MQSRRLALGLMGGVAAGALLLADSAGAAAKTATKAAPAPKAVVKAPVYTGIAREPYIGALCVDAATGRVVAEDKADNVGYPASMLKLMDLLIIQERIQQGALKLTDKIRVSGEVSKIGGSQVYLAENEEFTVEDLLYALMVQSANDAAAALACHVAGSKEAFVVLMNAKAKQLGMTATTFRSVHGLPPSAGQEPDVTTPRDFALLCREVVKHPAVLAYTSTKERTFRPAKPFIMRTHNLLLGTFEGCDGLKTGYFRNAGYSVAATAQRNGVRLIAIVMGSRDKKVCAQKAQEMLTQGFQSAAAAASGAK